MVSNLIAFGCSITYGEGLDDCWIVKKSKFGTRTKFGENPSKFAWPQKLADLMNLSCKNLGKPGASNKHISHIALNTEYKDSDIAVFLWTFFNRHCTMLDNGEIERYHHNDLGKKEFKKSRKKIEFYFNHMYTEKNSIHENYIIINHMKYYLDNLGVKNYHFMFQEDNFNNVPHWNNVQLKYIKWDYNDLALDDSHPGILAQSAIANAMYKTITEDTL